MRSHPHRDRLSLQSQPEDQRIADERDGHGAIDHAPVYSRKIARRAPEFSASADPLVLGEKETISMKAHSLI